MQTKDGKKYKANSERISLTPDSTVCVDNWLSDLRNTFQGIKLKRKDLVEWLIQSRSKELSGAEKKQIKDLFFDEVAHAQWIVKELRAAKERGEPKRLSDLLGTTRKPKPAAERKTTEANGGTDV